MTHGSLFSGIGGFDLAAEWMGWDNLFHCEWNPFCQKVLKYYWPKAESFNDITKTDFTKYANKIDILTGGFPCQPYSAAGKRRGKADERHLWPEMLRAIREIKPTFVVGENVRGLTNWNGGVVFEEVCADLENCGYEVQPVLLPACAVGAPHRRDRIWFVATNSNSRRLERTKESGWDSINAIGESEFRASTNSYSLRQHECECDNEEFTSQRWINALNDINENDGQGNASNPESICIQGQCKGQRKGKFKRGDWSRFPTQSPICGGNDGLPTQLDGITFSKWRNESIKGYGNAIVPQLALKIFKAIKHDYRRNGIINPCRKDT